MFIPKVVWQYSAMIWEITRALILLVYSQCFPQYCMVVPGLEKGLLSPFQLMTLKDLLISL